MFRQVVTFRKNGTFVVEIPDPFATSTDRYFDIVEISVRRNTGTSKQRDNPENRTKYCCVLLLLYVTTQVFFLIFDRLLCTSALKRLILQGVPKKLPYQKNCRVLCLRQPFVLIFSTRFPHIYTRLLCKNLLKNCGIS